MARGKGGASRAGGTAGRRLWRVAAAAFAVALLWMALGQGEYGTLDLLRSAAHRDSVAAEVAALRQQRDSLRAALEAVRTDPWRLEQLAREEHGMVQGDRELLYRFSRPALDTAVPDTMVPAPRAASR